MKSAPSIKSPLIWSFSSKFVLFILQLSSFIVLSRYLDPGIFGVFAAVIVIISFAQLSTEIGIIPAVIQKKTLSELDKNTAFTLTVLIGLVLSIVLYFVAPYYAKFFNFKDLESAVKAFSPVFFIRNTSIIGQAILERQLKFHTLAKIDLLSYIIGQILVCIPLAIAGIGVWSLVYGYIINYCIQSILLIKYSKQNFELKINKESGLYIWRFSVGFTYGRIFNYIGQQSDKIIAGKFLGQESLGLYSRAFQLVAMPAGLLSSVIEKVYFPFFSVLLHNDNSETVSNYFRKTYIVIVALTVPTSVGLAIVGPVLLPLVLGEEWGLIGVPLSVMSLTIFFRSIHKLNNTVAKAYGELVARANIQVVFAITTVIFGCAGAYFGIWQFCLGILLSMLLEYILMSKLVLRWLRIDISSCRDLVFLAIVLILSASALSLWTKAIILFLLHNERISILKIVLYTVMTVITTIIIISKFNFLEKTLIRNLIRK